MSAVPESPGRRVAFVRRLFDFSASSRAFPFWARYGLTALMLAIAAALNPFLLGFGVERPFLTFFPVVVLAGVLFDRGTSFFAIFGGAALGSYLFIPPLGSFTIDVERHLPGLVFFTLSCLLVAVLIEALHVAYADLVRSNAEAVSQEMRRHESAHRAANNLQRLAAVLHVQGGGEVDPAAQRVLRDTLERVQALARLHRRLEGLWDTKNGEADARDFLEGLCNDLREAALGTPRISLHLEAERHPLPPARLAPLGLITNELVANALKYAFPNDQPADVWVRFYREGAELVLEVEDNGAGLDPAAPARGTGLGTRLVRALAAQLGGRAAAEPGRGALAPEGTGGMGPGTRWTVRFPVTHP